MSYPTLVNPPGLEAFLRAHHLPLERGQALVRVIQRSFCYPRRPVGRCVACEQCHPLLEQAFRTGIKRFDPALGTPENYIGGAMRKIVNADIVDEIYEAPPPPKEDPWNPSSTQVISPSDWLR